MTCHKGKTLRKVFFYCKLFCQQCTVWSAQSLVNNILLRSQDITNYEDNWASYEGNCVINKYVIKYIPSIFSAVGHYVMSGYVFEIPPVINEITFGNARLCQFHV